MASAYRHSWPSRPPDDGLGVVEGYDESTYGDAMADVYDEWFGDDRRTDGTDATNAAVACLAALAEGGSVLELGVGTGRLALRLADVGLAVHGVDASQAMVERLRAKPGGDRVDVTIGDMAGLEPRGPFSLVFVALNTFFNLTTAQAQGRCLANVAGRLATGGRFVMEVFVPVEPVGAGSHVEVRSLTSDRVVLSVTTSDPTAQTAMGQYIEMTNGGGVRLRPWKIRWATPQQLDDQARAVGLVLEHRWADWSRREFSNESTHHVSVYRLGTRHNLL